MTGPVVVGVDGSMSSLTVVEAAAREAGLRGVGLRLAQAVAWPSEPVPSGVPPWDPDGGGLGEPVNGMLTEAERRARAVAPQVEVTSDVLLGEPMAVLESESRLASLTVVDGRGAGRLDGLLRGSVVGHLTAHGCCPVLVVRGRPEPTGPVVLVDDASPAAREAARFAFAEASVRGTDLVVLRTRSIRTRSPVGAPVGPRHGTRGGDGRQPRAAALSVLQKDHADVLVRARQLAGRAGRAVVEASAGAQLVVLGAPAMGRRANVLPGSVGRAALRHAQCPVAVIPGRKV
ncbi:universal stress protein [Streptomyces sp. NBC_00457]|uniref:universal stress protein n=1 Tax=unclassified Streptomyces TaxID=2593676 RepID=UPI002E214E75|nr:MULTISPECIES: universal stress protein [unclassified Streptomyces]